jgi:hypothetical protein
MGLRSNASAWPTFNWLDTSTKAPDANLGGYEHWGVLKGRRQPDNDVGGEWCAGGNYSMTFNEVWGWSDANCTGTYPYICRTAGGCSRPPQSVPDGDPAALCLTAPLPPCHPPQCPACTRTTAASLAHATC